MLSPSFRMTDQRQVIYDYVKDKSLTHPTAEHVFEAVRKKMPRISFGTVYRNLIVLEQMGLVCPLYYGKDHVRYDGIVTNHYHLVCEQCDKVENVSQEELLELNSQIQKRHNYKVTGHRLFFYGFCNDCSSVIK